MGRLDTKPMGRLDTNPMGSSEMVPWTHPHVQVGRDPRAGVTCPGARDTKATRAAPERSRSPPEPPLVPSPGLCWGRASLPQNQEDFSVCSAELFTELPGKGILRAPSGKGELETTSGSISGATRAPFAHGIGPEVAVGVGWDGMNFNLPWHPSMIVGWSTKPGQLLTLLQPLCARVPCRILLCWGPEPMAENVHD